jgi:hypothetical protein
MAARKRTVARRSSVDVQPTVKDYLLNRSMRERSAYFEDQLKKSLMTVLADTGVPEGTKRTLPLDEPLTFVEYKSGKPKEKIISGIERRERTSNVLNHDKALAFLTKKDLLDSCTTLVRVINEDAILAANYGGEITDKELSALYEESTTYAFYLSED